MHQLTSSEVPDKDKDFFLFRIRIFFCWSCVQFCPPPRLIVLQRRGDFCAHTFRATLDFKQHHLAALCWVGGTSNVNGF